MIGILTKLLEKRGIKKVEELSSEERATFDQYEKVLSKSELTLEDMKVFLTQQVGVIDAKWKSFDMDQSKKAELLPYYVVYKTLKDAIGAPQVEREALERYLNQLLK